VIFAFNRPEKLRRCLESLISNTCVNDFEIHIFVDAPLSPFDKAQNILIRELLCDKDLMKNFGNAKVVYRTVNIGMVNNVLTSINTIFESYEMAIFLEDDLIVSPVFLEFMRHYLYLYLEEVKIFSISGFSYPIDIPNCTAGYFLRGAECWGWATWKNRWKYFEPSSATLYNKLLEKRLLYNFDFNGSYPFSYLLKKNIVDEFRSWAIKLYASAYINEFLTFYPCTSLVVNDGFDSIATNTKRNSLGIPKSLTTSTISYENPAIIEIENNRVLLSQYLLNKSSLFHKVLYFIRNHSIMKDRLNK
jgi:hypothetical protein